LGTAATVVSKGVEVVMVGPFSIVAANLEMVAVVVVVVVAGTRGVTKASTLLATRAVLIISKRDVNFMIKLATTVIFDWKK